LHRPEKVLYYLLIVMAPSKKKKGPGPFSVRDCALVSLATGISAQNLKEFREGLLSVHPGSIYHHFWGRLLQPRFDEPEYNNDFASWAFRALNDKALAERLSVVDPTELETIEDIRQELLEIVEMRLDESEMIPWAKADQQFHFIRSQIVVLDTGLRLKSPEELARVVPMMSSGSIFYHFIDARRRTDDGSDDFSSWLSGYGNSYQDLIARLQMVEPYFFSLKNTRKTLSEIFDRFFRLGEGMVCE